MASVSRHTCLDTDDVIGASLITIGMEHSGAYDVIGASHVCGV